MSAVAFTGCVTSYEVNVSLSPKLKELYGEYPSLEVDVAGVDANGLERFEATPVDDYFTVGNALRGCSPHATLRFRADDFGMRTLESGDDVWDAFDDLGADRVVLLVNLPPLPEKIEKQQEGKKDDGKDSAKKDFRRLVIPLENHWYSSDVRNFEITPAGINLIKD